MQVATVLDNDPVLKKFCGETWGSTGEPCRLSLGIMYEKGLGDDSFHDSFWSPYFDSIPAEQTSPILWSKEDIALLESRRIIENVVSLQNYLQTLYMQVVPHLIKTYDSLKVTSQTIIFHLQFRYGSSRACTVAPEARRRYSITTQQCSYAWCH